MEVLATPLCSVFACMTVEDGKKALTMNLTKGGDESMGILHEPSWALGVSNCTFILELSWPMGRRFLILQGKLNCEWTG